MAGHRMGSDSTRLNHRYLRYCPAQASTSRGSASLQPSSWDPAGARGSLYRLTQICGNQMVSADHRVRAPVHCTLGSPQHTTASALLQLLRRTQLCYEGRGSTLTLFLTLVDDSAS